MKFFTRKSFDSAAKGLLLLAPVSFCIQLIFGKSLGEALSLLVVYVVMAGFAWGIGGELKE